MKQLQLFACLSPRLSSPEIFSWRLINSEQGKGKKKRKEKKTLNNDFRSLIFRPENEISFKFVLGSWTFVENVRAGASSFPPNVMELFHVWWTSFLPFDGGHLWLRTEETEEGITCHLLITLPQSGNKACAASAAASPLSFPVWQEIVSGAQPIGATLIRPPSSRFFIKA